MNAQQQIDTLRREISQLQQGGTVLPEAIQRQLQALQNQLQQVPPVRPLHLVTPADVASSTPLVALTPEEAAVWQSFLDFHAALLSYSGGVNRQQWLHLVDVAADMTSSVASESAPVTEAPGGVMQPWVRNGEAGTWVLLSTVAPPTVNPPGGANNYAPLMGRTTGTTPAAGQIGEVVQASTASGTTISIPVQNSPTPTYTALVNMALSPGDWDVEGYVTWRTSGVTSTNGFGSFATVSTTPPPNVTLLGGATGLYLKPNYTDTGIPLLTNQVTTSMLSTVYLVTYVTSPDAGDLSKNLQAWGALRARRMS